LKSLEWLDWCSCLKLAMISRTTYCLGSGPGAAMPDVFISYKRENAAKVGRLVAALKGQGLDVWWDRDIPPGAPWEATIEQTLTGAKAVIVCWSRAAVASENVRSEARLARNQGRLIQVFLEPCEPPLFFGERQGIDLRNWRGAPNDPRITQLIEATRAMAEDKAPAQLPVAAGSGLGLTRAVLAAVLALLLAVAAGWLILKPGEGAGPVTLAVLPFRSLSAADVNLTDAIADDTRSAIGHNPNLRVLCRLAVTALAQQGASPQDIRRKVGADYLLDGSVQRDGQLLRIKVSLVRAKDAAEVWADQLDGRVDDVFAFQGRIAREVEGRIRGRLAPNQGIKAENITTSGAVYAIYADARALDRKRAPETSKQGVALLKKALAKDPNFAPAWAELGIMTGLGGAFPGVPKDKLRKDAVAHLNRALTLAPNLAVAHAALAMVQDNPPELEPELRKAVELDPNNAEAWNWLGTMNLGQNKIRQGIAAYRRANEIEPLWTAPIGNLIGSLTVLGDETALANLIRSVERTGDAALLTKARYYSASAHGHVGEALRLGFRLRSDHPQERSFIEARMLRSLIQLGYITQAAKLADWDPDVAAFSGATPAAAELASYERPIDLWLDGAEPMILARTLPKHGRLKEFVNYYNAAFKSPEEFYDLSPSGNKGLFRSFAPNVSVLLSAVGQSKEAEALLARDEQVIAGFLKNGPADGGMLINLAQLRAAQGRDDQAVRFIREALAKGYLPDRQLESVDIADEPCFAQLVKRADFQALRKRILDRIQAERRIAAPAVAAAKL
jgi:serine/threonine-protein kinase